MNNDDKWRQVVDDLKDQNEMLKKALEEILSKSYGVPAGIAGRTLTNLMDKKSESKMVQRRQ